MRGLDNTGANHMIKLYLVNIKDEPEKGDSIATKFYGQRYEVLIDNIWRSYFAHELFNIRAATIEAQAVNQP